MENTQEEKKVVSDGLFSRDESCLFPENTRYSIDFRGKIWDNVKNRQLKNRAKVQGYPTAALGAFEGAEHIGMIYMHRMLGITFLHNPDNLDEIDHIDADRENFDLSNLRWCTVSQQNANRTINRKRKLPRWVGMMRGKYQVRYTLRGKGYCLGSYATVEEADRVAKKARKEIHGEFARDV